MRNNKSATILTVCLVSLGVLFLGSFGRHIWTAFSQEGPAYYSVQMYASYQYNVLDHPTGLLVLPDIQGVNYLYIADTGNHQVRRFKIGFGPLVIVTGTGAPGYVNGSTSVAQFDNPTGLSGTAGLYAYEDPFTHQIRQGTYHNVFISDTKNFVMRKLCSNLGPGPYPPCQTVQTACGSHNFGMVDGPSLSASFAGLAGLSVGGGSNEYYMADAGNHSIREWDGSNVSTYAGNGTPGYSNGYRTNAQFYVPGKMTQDASGNMYIADIENHAIRKIDYAGNVTTLAGAGPTQPGFVNGTGSAAEFTRPTSVAFNSSDNMIYVADSHNNCIRRIDSSGNVTTYAGTGAAGLVNGSLAQAEFSMPSDIAIANGVMYISDTMNNVIRRIDMNTGLVSTYIS
jgi:hypothetical protein